MRCGVIKDNGDVCGISFDDMPYLTFRDSHGIKLKNYDTNEFGICQNHYQQRISVLTDEETGTVNLLKNLRKKQQSFFKLDAVQKAQQREKIVEHSVKIKHWMDILYTIQKKKCRLCKHLLNDEGCTQCEKRVLGDSKKYSYIGTFNSNNTPRKTGLLLHTLCGRIFMQNVFGFKLLASAYGQHTLFDSLELPKIE